MWPAGKTIGRAVGRRAGQWLRTEPHKGDDRLRRLIGNTRGRRIPAEGVERLVIERLRQFLAQPSSVLEHLLAFAPNLARLEELTRRAAKLTSTWPEMSSSEQRSILRTLIARVERHHERVDFQLSHSRLANLLGGEPEAPLGDLPHEARFTTLSVEAQLQRVGWGGKMIVAEKSPFALTKPDPAMVKLLVRAHDLKRKLLQGGRDSLAELARRGSERFLRHAAAEAGLPRPQHR